MQNKNTSPPNRIWLYIVLMIVLLVVLIIVVIKQRMFSTTSTTQLTLREQTSGDDTPVNTGTTPPNPPQTPGGMRDIIPTREASDEATRQSEKDTTYGNNKTSNTTDGGSYAPLGCSVNLGKVCTIKKNDDIFSALGQGSDAELLVNGIKIKPNKIVYQTSSETYKDEQMKDGQGKVLSSTNKEYDANTKTLTISVGANPNYYNNLQPTEQRLLYLSQTVRSFMAMFGETPENFIKVEKVVNELGSWQPTP
jgi:biopolymer transport protein ExbD